MKTFIVSAAAALLAIMLGVVAVVWTSLSAKANYASNYNAGQVVQFCFRKPFNGDLRISSHATAGRKHPTLGISRPHYGDDLAMPSNTPIYAPADGVVQTVATQRVGAGNYISIQHPNGYLTRYLHLNSISVHNGQRVQTGELIGYSGMTGGISTGPHLHWEAHQPGYKNPFPPVGPTYLLCEGAPPASTEVESMKTSDPSQTVAWTEGSDAPDPAWESCPIQPPPMRPEEWRLDMMDQKSKPY